MEVKEEYEIGESSQYKSKKYVIRIYPENVEYVDSLETRERNQFINDAISVYFDKHREYERKITLKEKIKKIIQYSICAIIMITLFGAIIRFLMIYSDESDARMEKNFQTLFENYHISQ